MYSKNDDGISIASLIKDGTITYMHTHAICESLFEGVEHIFESLDSKLEPLLKYIKKLNIGGGALYTSEYFDVAAFNSLIKNFLGKNIII